MSKKTFKGKLDYVRQDDEDDALPNKGDADRIGGLMAPNFCEGTRRLAAAREIPIDRIRPDSNQPRTSYRKEGIEELAETIRQIGIINPIQVRYVESDDLFEIISGERRFRAAQ